MGRADLIGNGKKHLVPSFQPAGNADGRSKGRSSGARANKFRTQHTR